jgi:hypothetical protein
MKTALTPFATVAGFALILSTVLAAPACKKDETCHGNVHVIDTAGTPVGNAAVELSAPNGDITYTGVTDGSGDVSFEVTLPAIFDVTASKTGVGTGVGVIRLDEPGKEDDVTVTIQ